MIFLWSLRIVIFFIILFATNPHPDGVVESSEWSSLKNMKFNDNSFDTNAGGVREALNRALLSQTYDNYYLFGVCKRSSFWSRNDPDVYVGFLYRWFRLGPLKEFQNEVVNQTPFHQQCIALLVFVHAVLFLVPCVNRSWLCCSWYQAFVRGHLWTVMTAGFVHADVIHLATNCLSIFYSGPAFAVAVPCPWKVFLFGIVGGNLFSLFARGRRHRMQDACGASGGLYALLVAAALHSADVASLYDDWHRVLMLLSFNLLTDMARPRVDVACHVGGALTGSFLFYYWK